jgi:hypothetical protein
MQSTTERNPMNTQLRRGARVALPLALIALAAPAGAGAATVERGGDGGLVYRGGAGGSGVNVGLSDGGRITFSSSLGDEIVAVTGGCERPDDDPYLALCDAPAAGIAVEMGDGDDSVNVRDVLPVPARIDGGDGPDVLGGLYEGGSETIAGGPGNDSVNGRGGADHVDGGSGDDKVRGGPGADIVLGGEGTDTLSGDDDATVSADVLDGGPGLDTLEGEWSTVGREGRGPVSVTLGGGADDGFAGEGDDVRDLERVSSVSGGSYTGTDAGEELLVGNEPATVDGRGGDDRIISSYSADTLRGGAGDDEIRGYGGDDRIEGGPGADTLAGDTVGQTCNALTCSIYSGNDTIDARDGERDSIDCGLGTDRLVADPVDVHTNCEDVAADPAPVPGPPGVGAQLTIPKQSLKRALLKGLTVRVAGAQPGRLAVNVRYGKTVVASGTVKIAAGGGGQASLRFSRAGSRRLRSVKRPTLAVSAGNVSKKVKLL